MTKPPPVPKENRSPKGTGDDKAGTANAAQSGEGERNLQEQGRQGNIKQNTTNQGYQQDR
jgi:hypothetical protein